MQGFTSHASIWQDAGDQAAGLNPLMQTPAPAMRGSVFSPPVADASQTKTAQAVLRKTKISPKKLNEFARLIRRMHIDDALRQCQVAPNKAAKLCYKVLSPSVGWLAIKYSLKLSLVLVQLHDNLFGRTFHVSGSPIKRRSV